MTNSTSKLAREAAERITGERWCTTCQQHRKLAEGPGISKVTGKGKTITRWICEVCARGKGLR